MIEARTKKAQLEFEYVAWAWMHSYKEIGRDPTREELAEMLDRRTPWGREWAEQLVQHWY